MIKKLFTLLIMWLVTNLAWANLNSATIIEATITAIPKCLHYRYRGFCTWYSPYTGFSYTPYVEHYLPDLVVTVFNKPGDDPWMEVNQTLDAAGSKAQETIVSQLSGFNVGSGQHSDSNVHERNVFFKEVDVIGNPALSVISGFVPEYVLNSVAAPLMPYYQSMLDSAAWRGFPQIPTNIAEEKYASIADLVRHVGTPLPLIDWGGVLPHEGKVATTNDAKAAAVIAQRASDLTTASLLYAHIRQPLSTVCGRECTAAAIQENSKDTEFQMVYPKEEDTCDYFGKTISYGNDAEQQAQGAYTWILWRFYQGCEDGAGTFVSKTIVN
jgi:integrating conjugative element protein (TIGR03756 family)